MRFFQNSGVYPAYQRYFDRVNGARQNFTDRRNSYLADGFGAPHILKPVWEFEPDAFFTNGDDTYLQSSWARENGLSPRATLEEILLAQIEDHRTEVFYNLDPMRFGSQFVRRLPGTVRKSICWRAAPSPNADFGAYDLVLCNFQGILEQWRARGWQAEVFYPAHDPFLGALSQNTERNIDVSFVGSFSRHHRARAEVLETLATLSKDFDVRFHLNSSRITKLADTPLLRVIPMGRLRRPSKIRRVSREPIFGRQLYEVFSRSKIVVNVAIDMAGSDRGNMRCFEAMGAGALLLSDSGTYPGGMEPGKNLSTFSTPEDAKAQALRILSDWESHREIADAGKAMIQTRYSRDRQWQRFIDLVSSH